MKKPTLYVYGDSFSVPKNQFLNSMSYVDNKNKLVPEDIVSWRDLVMNKLKTTDTYGGQANYGVSNEWILKNLTEEINNISEEDYIIIQTTCASRHWFFEDKPYLSNITSIRPDYFNKGENKAIQGYLKYMQSDNLDNIILLSMIHTFEYIRRVSKCKILVIPAWHSYPNVIGDLNMVNDAEFKSGATRDKFYAKYNYFDPRLNHMSDNNHKILASKIVDWFQHNIPLNLTKDFETKIYTEE